MVLGPVLLTLVLAVAAAWRGCPRVAAAASTSTLVAFVLLSAGPLPALILDSLQNQPTLKQPRWGRDNVIVVIGAGTVRRGDEVFNHLLGYSRVQEAARLYADCRRVRQRRCLLVTSGGDPVGTGEAEARVLARDLITLGVPPGAPLIEDQSANTYANARLTKRLLTGTTVDRLVVVTSGFHARRARRYFEFFFGDVATAPSDFVRVPTDWWPRARTLDLVDLAAHEFAGEVRFDLYTYLGWNAR